MKQQLIQAMKHTFGDDQRRIDHALRVLAYAERILEEDDADELTVVAAAILHDIGIREAERKHGSSAPRFQEEEGPPIAKAILEDLQIEPDVVEHVCRIVASHHSARDIDTTEFRIVWDADWLVNIPDEHPDASPTRLARLIDNVFRTTCGKRIASEEFLEKDA